MSENIYWSSTSKGKRVGGNDITLKNAFRRRYSSGRAVLGFGQLDWLEGVKDAMVDYQDQRDAAQALIDAINEFEEIEVWLE